MSEQETNVGYSGLSPQERSALGLVRELGLVRPGDLEERGISRRHLSKLADKGVIERLARGLYAAPGAAVSELQSLAETAKLYPNAVVCLLSALQLHGLTTQMPRRVWVAIDGNARKPTRATVSLEVVRFTGRALSEGIEQHMISGVAVKVYSVGKTVADCFKLRSRIGLDVAVEALRDALRERRVTVDELLRYGRVCRVEQVMSPYVEALL
jgi:predicted transcriptional regulator of viral defense system